MSLTLAMSLTLTASSALPVRLRRTGPCGFARAHAITPINMFGCQICDPKVGAITPISAQTLEYAGFYMRTKMTTEGGLAPNDVIQIDLAYSHSSRTKWEGSSSHLMLEL